MKLDQIPKTIKKVHVTQIYNINIKETELEFFDTNLQYDSKLFIDPFLIKTSEIEKERKLYERFTLYFKTALNKSLEIIKDENKSKKLLKFLSFQEPKEICLGYTEKSNKGVGLGNAFASGMYQFFIKGAASRLITNEKLYFNKLIDPKIFSVFANKVNQDGISDLSANLIMDYLIEFTREQCSKWKIPTNKALPVSEMFDFEYLEWTGGRNITLPENPFRPGEPFILVPKRFLRASEDVHSDAKRKIIGILKLDSSLAFKFSRLVKKSFDDVSMEEIREALTDSLVLEKFINYIESKKEYPYNFIIDPLDFYAFKKYENYFKDSQIQNQPQTCDEVLGLTKTFFKVFQEEFEFKDGWKDTWIRKNNGKLSPCIEEVWGRKLRAMGSAFFYSYPEVTFLQEIGTGNGRVDFSVIYKNCRIAIEIKKLANSNLTGTGIVLPAYIHGIAKQLPLYIVNIKAKYGFYITGQHYKQKLGVRGKISRNDDNRAKEIKKLLPKVKGEIIKKFADFQELFYINIDLSFKPSPSKL